jgi:hypothetical protein
MQPSSASCKVEAALIRFEKTNGAVKIHSAIDELATGQEL